MHPEMERELSRQRIEDLRRAGGSTRGPAVARAVSARGEDVAIRAAQRSDRAALAALAALDGALPPIGGALVAEVRGSIVAALPLGGGRALADPFRHTSDLVALLEARAGQLERERRAGHERRRVLGWLAPAALRRLV
jgi:hypothetical protein